MRFPFKIPENKIFDVAGFGTNAVDLLIQVPEYPAFDSKIELTRYTQTAGGEIASTMVGLARLKMKTAYAGRFGKDAAGDFGLKNLREENVDVEYAEQIENAKTQIAFILIDERSGERTVVWQRDAKLAYAESEAPLAITKNCKIFHATPHDVPACAKMARAAKDSEAIVSLDIDNLFEGVEQLLPLVDIFVSSAEFPGKLTGIENQKAALREIKSRCGCGIVGMTRGRGGSLLLCENEFIETEGFEVPGGCLDTTGAGDAFRVGLLYGLLKGETVETSAKMANAVAALKCRNLGAMTALPTPNELFGLINS